MDGEQIVPEFTAPAPIPQKQELTEEEIEKKIEESRQRALSKKRERELMLQQ